MCHQHTVTQCVTYVPVDEILAFDEYASIRGDAIKGVLVSDAASVKHCDCNRWCGVDGTH